MKMRISELSEYDQERVEFAKEFSDATIWIRIDVGKVQHACLVKADGDYVVPVTQ